MPRSPPTRRRSSRSSISPSRLTRAGRTRDALAAYQALLAAAPDHVTAQFYCANLLASLNAFEAARAGLRPGAGALTPTMPRPIAIAVWSPPHARMRPPPKPISRPRSAGTRASRGAWRQLGKLCVGARRHADATVAFTRLSALLPDDPVPHCQRAQALAACGESDAAIGAFERAIQLSPAPYPEALRGLASLELGRGNQHAAQRHYAGAAAAEPVIPWHGATGRRSSPRAGPDRARPRQHRRSSIWSPPRPTRSASCWCCPGSTTTPRAWPRAAI
ncbi:MAG: tetratricopeptide repeat protein [Pseudomonadota bacterium]